MTRILFFLSFFLVLTSCSVFKTVPQPTHEFRGFWVATVVNIDWPKNGTDAIEKKKTDYLKILDFYQDLNFNTAIVQVRTAGDAFYKSEFAPWSRFLTGEEGTPPNTQENLLTWMIDQTHERGMEFHAWLNPYRATFDLKTEVLSSEHDFNLHPEWMLKYGKKFYYDPGLPEVQQHMAFIIDEIVSDYDIDGVHYDDYFYPYTIKDEVFKDSVSYYNCGLPDQSIEDWRRSNIDSLVKQSHNIIKAKKPWVQFGVSPFGVWKNKSTDPRGSDTRAGQTTYENLYADPLLWMEEGWLDYIVPQVYWSMDLPVASHRKIVNWWAKNSEKTNLFIGNGPYKIRNNSDQAWQKKKELPNQLSLARETKEVNGNVFFSAKSLMKKNKDVVRFIKRKYYKQIAFQPKSKYVHNTEVLSPSLESFSIEENKVNLLFDSLDSLRFAYIFPENKKKLSTKKLLDQVFINDKKKLLISRDDLKGNKQLRIVFTDRFGRKSEPIIVHLNQTN